MIPYHNLSLALCPTMRLINTYNLKLYEFYDSAIPDYAILSHTWTEQEVTLQMLEDPQSKTLAGYTKIKRCCELALSEGWKYAWIDTCCIDKTSSADLSEAINAMYGWYEKARVCYVYMADMSLAYQHKSGLSPNFNDRFRKSRWFFRGWTLQELLAPKTVVFYGREWEELGTKWSLQYEISRVTGIKPYQLIDHKRASIATKMSWAALRGTTRVEDAAYSMLGLFDINMPRLYGEGPKAFMRLQYEILQTHENDESIFAWRDSLYYPCGLLARSPAAFTLSGHIMPIKAPHGRVKPLSITRKLLSMDGLLPMSEYVPGEETHHTQNSFPYIVLNCIQLGVDSKVGNVVGIALTDQELDYTGITSPRDSGQSTSRLDFFIRSSPGQLLQCSCTRDSPSLVSQEYLRKTMEISLDHVSLRRKRGDVSFRERHQAASFLPSLASVGFTLSEVYPHDAAFIKLPSVFPLKTRPEGWKILTDPLTLPVAAMMFHNQIGESFAVILHAIELSVNIDIVVPKARETLIDIMVQEKPFLKRERIIDRCSTHLQVKHDICATSRMRFINYETIYYVDIKTSATDLRPPRWKVLDPT